MKYPEQYPDGFMKAAQKAKDMKIILEGVNFYQGKIDSAISTMRASDLPLAVFALNTAKETLLQYDPDARIVVDALAEIIGTRGVIIPAKEK